MGISSVPGEKDEEEDDEGTGNGENGDGTGNGDFETDPLASYKEEATGIMNEIAARTLDDARRPQHYPEGSGEKDFLDPQDSDYLYPYPRSESEVKQTHYYYGVDRTSGRTSKDRPEERSFHVWRIFNLMKARFDGIRDTLATNLYEADLAEKKQELRDFLERLVFQGRKGYFAQERKNRHPMLLPDEINYFLTTEITRDPMEEVTSGLFGTTYKFYEIGPFATSLDTGSWEYNEGGIDVYRADPMLDISGPPPPNQTINRNPSGGSNDGGSGLVGGIREGIDQSGNTGTDLVNEGSDAVGGIVDDGKEFVDETVGKIPNYFSVGAGDGTFEQVSGSNKRGSLDAALRQARGGTSVGRQPAQAGVSVGTQPVQQGSGVRLVGEGLLDTAGKQYPENVPYVQTSLDLEDEYAQLTYDRKRKLRFGMQEDRPEKLQRTFQFRNVRRPTWDKGKREIPEGGRSVVALYKPPKSVRSVNLNGLPTLPAEVRPKVFDVRYDEQGAKLVERQRLGPRQVRLAEKPEVLRATQIPPTPQEPSGSMRFEGQGETRMKRIQAEMRGNKNFRNYGGRGVARKGAGYNLMN